MSCGRIEVSREMDQGTCMSVLWGDQEESWVGSRLCVLEGSTGVSYGGTGVNKYCCCGCLVMRMTRTERDN